MLEVKLLGQFEVKLESVRLSIPSRNAQALFAYLVLHAGKSHRREWLAGLLWPDSSEENARSNLRHELWRLRKAFESSGESCFLVDDLSITFISPSKYYLDVERLERAPSASNPTDDLIKALSIYGGELLPGFYNEWIFMERARLNALFEAKIAHLLEILQNEGRWAEVVDWGMSWIAWGQMPEPAYRALISAHANSGDLPKAIATYEQYAQALQKDMGIMPSEQTQALYKRLKTGWKEGPPMDPPEATKPLKSHLATVSPTPFLPRLRRSNLPRPLTSFIGRENEIQKVVNLVSKARMVTITGAGGVGKTRLAIQVAGSLIPQFRDGAWWVGLATLSKANFSQKWNPGEKRDTYIALEEQFGEGLIAQAAAKTLRVQQVPGQAILDALLAYLHDKQILLVFDNCEHLIEECSILVERLLTECPELSILATSREALGVPSEKAWRLPSLSLPGQALSKDVRNILLSEAVRLFVERTTDVVPGFFPREKDIAAIAKVCLRLDGIPLAIELAAARMNLLSIQEIAVRLDRSFQLLTEGHRTALLRHQTLQAAIEWSYALLNEAEQVLFRRLSIFAGSFSLAAAEAVCASHEIPTNEVLTLLGRLVNKSMLNVEPPRENSDLPTRFRYLDTIRSFSRLKLEETTEFQWLRDRYGSYYIQLVETAEPELLLQNQEYWFKLLQAEYDNLSAVIEWSTNSDLAESALKLVGALLWFWFSYGSTREGCDMALKALATPSSIKYTKARVRALNTAGFFLCLLGDSAYARQKLEEALSIQRTNEDKVSLAWSLQFLGLALAYDKEYDLADSTFEKGLALTRNSGDGHANNFLHFLGDIILQKGDYSRAKRIYEDSANNLRTIGNKSFLAYPLRRLGYLALEENDNLKAWRYFQESMAVNLEIGDNRAIAACLVSLAALALKMENPTTAARLLGLVESHLETLSFNLLPLDQAEVVRISTKLLSCLDEATIRVAFTQGEEMNVSQAFEQALAYFGEKFDPRNGKFVWGANGSPAG
jgi:predicted ATPase/DNA-binding SARP family transcriptional activator